MNKLILIGLFLLILPFATANIGYLDEDYPGQALTKIYNSDDVIKCKNLGECQRSCIDGAEWLLHERDTKVKGINNCLSQCRKNYLEEYDIGFHYAWEGKDYTIFSYAWEGKDYTIFNYTLCNQDYWESMGGLNDENDKINAWLKRRPVEFKPRGHDDFNRTLERCIEADFSKVEMFFEDKETNKKAKAQHKIIPKKICYTLTKKYGNMGDFFKDSPTFGNRRIVEYNCNGDDRYSIEEITTFASSYHGQDNLEIELFDNREREIGTCAIWLEEIKK